MHNIYRGDNGPATSRTRIMQKFALKMLLTSLIVRRGSKRLRYSAQLAASLLMLVAIVLVGLLCGWSRGQY